MASRYLLDTNTASYIIKGNIPAVRRRLLRVPMAQVAVSTVTEGELHYGVARRNSTGISVPISNASDSRWATST
jgi:tRNA(fMet)-specific endonuclease VapC